MTGDGGEGPRSGPDPWELPAPLRAKYAFERWLGHGATSVVYLGRQTNLGRRVVVKVLKRPELDMEERFLREAQALSAMRHPGIVQLLDYGEAGNRLYMTYSYEEGQTLAAVFDERGALPWREAARIGRQLALALGEAHGKTIVHRDVKPGNVLLAADGTAKLLDFGFSRLPGSTLTAAGEYIGTPAYSAPEHCHTGDCDARSDLYSLGVILYQALTGDNPFRGASTVESMQLQLSLRVTSFPPAAPYVPEELKRVVLDMLEKAPEDRPAMALDVANRLAAVLAGPSVPPGVAATRAGAASSRRAKVSPPPADRDGGAGGEDGAATRPIPAAGSSTPPGAFTPPDPVPSGYRSMRLAIALAAALAGAGVLVVTRQPPTSAGATPEGQSAARPLLEPSALAFELTPAGRVEAVEFELPVACQSRVEEESGAIGGWSRLEKRHKLQRVGMALSGRFFVTVRPPGELARRTGPYAGDVPGALRETAISPEQLSTLADAVDRAICDSAGRPQPSVSLVPDALARHPLVLLLRRLGPCFAREASARVRLPLADRRRLLLVQRAAGEIARLAHFVGARSGDGRPIRELVPLGLWPHREPARADDAIGTADCQPDEGLKAAPDGGGCAPSQPAGPTVTCGIVVPPQGRASSALIECAAAGGEAGASFRVVVTGDPPGGGESLSQTFYAAPSPDAGRDRGPAHFRLDPVFLACASLRLEIAPLQLPIERPTGGAATDARRLVRARLVLLP